MRNRSHTLFFSGILVAATVLFAVRTLGAQAAKAPAQKAAKAAPARAAATLPRTADGHPDLQGVYDVATVTPVERPAEAGGRLVLTNEEAAAAEAYDHQREARTPRRSAAIAEPLRRRARGAEDVARSGRAPAGGGTAGHNRFWIERAASSPSTARSASILIDPPDGKIPR